MNRARLLLLPLLVAPALAWAQDAAGMAAERERIAQQRERQEALHLQERRTCYQRFAVNACLDEVRTRHNGIMGDLRRQEIALNDQERSQRAALRLRELEERQSEERRREEEARRQQALQDSREREERAAQKAEDARQAASAAGRRAQRQQSQQARPAPAPVDEAGNRAVFQERQRDAAERRERLQRRQAEDTGPRPRPLPTPP